MRILLTESDPSQAVAVEAVLAGAGHEVVACTDGTTPFPCRGADGAPCPLDEGVTVAVSAPGSVPPTPRAGDVGVVCVTRRTVPLVVVAPDPRAAGGGVVSLEALPDAVEEAATSPLRRHTDAVVEVVRREVGEDADATVHRVGRDLLVRLDLPASVDRRRADALAVRAEAVVRAVDPWAAKVDVTLTPS